MRDLRTPEWSNTPMHVYPAKDYQLHKKCNSDLWFQGDIDGLRPVCNNFGEKTPVLDFGI